MSNVVVTVNSPTTAPPTVSVSSGVSNSTSVGVSTPNNERPVEPYLMGYAGVLIPTVGAGALYLEGPFSIETIRFTLATPSLSGAVVLDVKCNGVSIYSAPPQIPANETTVRGSANLIKTNFVLGDRITVDIISGGLSQTAADLTVTLRLKRLF